MKKIIALALACMLLLCACNGTDQPNQTTTKAPNQTTAPTVLDLEAIFAQMAAATQEEMTAIKPERLLDLYGIAAEDCLEVYVYSYNSGMMAAEVWLIRAASPEAQARLKTLAENRLEYLDEESASYSPEMNKVVKKAQVICRGEYLAMICSVEVEALANIFNNA